MSSSFGASVLSTFDVRKNERDFLSQLIESPLTPARETRQLVDTSILANAEDFHYLIHCARSIQQAKQLPFDNFSSNDVLTFVWHILAGKPKVSDAEPKPWAETDRLILLAKKLAQDPIIRGPIGSSVARSARPVGRAPRQVKSSNHGTASHYWSTEASTQDEASNHRIPLADGCLQQSCLKKQYLGTSTANIRRRINLANQEGATVSSTTIAPRPQNLESNYPQRQSTTSRAAFPRPISQVSPFFAQEIIDKKLSKRPAAGVVSSVPFPPLWSSQFGLIQERLAHEPFWLLIAVTFLIKTSGQASIPVFYKVRERFPSPTELGDPSNAEELFRMIRHLGLAVNRLSLIRKYAEAFMKSPPTPGKVYKVRNYEKRNDLLFAAGIGMEDLNSNGESKWVTRAATDGEADAEAWEIGHMTQGKYTLDSWRIFCRDELLGRAQDWNGKGQRAGFQPEWMRVVPHDKELRAYLRWMWMREGWEWNPETGERQVLRPELQAAVNEGRVEYDNAGGLRILDAHRW
ncbi:hypothetical protein ED733_005635 [Metarhizium rileyi]|uniref:Methyl-CpG-binding domain-containing protein 4 n=1 Tax=Metarhizium rileyi (strain RCEF 4871) TaxID=1649241 RepID=A0A5C6GCK8_METRR|nr:hypothetical protein ED733_005635 [Metarhizium rileyi]